MTQAGTAKQNWRPKTLADVAERSVAHGNIDVFLREFLDSFYAETSSSQRITMLAEEPRLLDERANAYLAAVAEHLSQRMDVAAPSWSNKPTRFLHRAYFPCGLESLKATLIKESPPAFRRRLIFVGGTPLSRPHSESPLAREAL